MKKETDNSYLYVAQQIDVLGREISISDKKIGITNNPHVREMQLSKTLMPTSVAYVKLYKFVGNKIAGLIESGIFHNLLADRNTIGEWFSDDDGDIIYKVSKTIQTLINSGFDIQEIDLSQDKKSSNAEKVAISKAKAASDQIYLDLSKVDKATNEDDNYSLWLLTTVDGETYPQIYNLNTTRAAGKKATPETVINYCNANSFLEKVGFDRTKITAKFIVSSNDKEEINNKKRELKK
tara:strand:+ start:100 stop:810 length:711 start_codon:yes stop_codon:yes gene_type:complete